MRASRFDAKASSCNLHSCIRAIPSFPRIPSEDPRMTVALAARSRRTAQTTNVRGRRRAFRRINEGVRDGGWGNPSSFSASRQDTYYRAVRRDVPGWWRPSRVRRRIPARGYNRGCNSPSRLILPPRVAPSAKQSASSRRDSTRVSYRSRNPDRPGRIFTRGISSTASPGSFQRNLV